MQLVHKRKQVGEIKNGIYFTVRKFKTFFIKFQGFGISEEILKELVEKEVSEIRIIYFGKEGRRVYKSCVRDFFHYGSAYTDGTDKQRILAIKKMEMEI